MTARTTLAACLQTLLLLAATTARSAEGPAVAARGEGDRPARQPQLAVTPGGHAYLAFGVGDSIRVAVSDDGGASFGPAVTVGTPGVLALGMRRGPRIAATDKVAVIAAIGGRGDKPAAIAPPRATSTGGHGGVRQDANLLTWRSTDGGRSWSGPSRVNGPEGSAREGLHALAVGPDGTFFCVWNDNRDGTMAVYGARSTDGGATWEPDAPVYRSAEKGICPCCHPSVAYGPDGTLYVMWRNSVGGNRDMFLAESTDGGRTFAPARKQGQGSWMIEGCPMDGGAIVPPTADGRVETVWMRKFAVYRSRPGEPETKLGEGIQAWAAPGPGGLHAAWLLGRPGKLFALTPGDAEPTILAEAANDPVVAGPSDGRGPVVAAWESPTDRTIRAVVLAPRR